MFPLCAESRRTRISRRTRRRPLHLIVLLRKHLSAAITSSDWYLIRAIRAIRVIRVIRDSGEQKLYTPNRFDTQIS